MLDFWMKQQRRSRLFDHHHQQYQYHQTTTPTKTEDCFHCNFIIIPSILINQSQYSRKHSEHE